MSESVRKVSAVELDKVKLRLEQLHMQQLSSRRG